jgi:hypothetical protein
MRARSGFLLLAATAVTALAGCVAPSAQAPPVQAAAPRPMAEQGLAGVIGSTAAALATQLGRFDLDLREGPARKLQFQGPACVLDAYLYPPRSGAEPVVTHIDARLPDGREMDRASCVAALAARTPAR